MLNKGDIADRLSRLSESQRAFVRDRLRGRDTQPAHALRIQKRVDGSMAPLSFAQRRLWFINQLSPHISAYNIPTCVKLKGRLNVAAFKQSIYELIRRHETLRTTFTVQEEIPMQKVADAWVQNIQIVNFDRVVSRDREDLILKFAKIEALRPFDLVEGPLLRVTLLRFTQTDHVILFTLHHIIADGWSKSILVREFGQIYQDFCAGERLSLAELPVQYGDFAVWQRDHLRDNVLAGDMVFWKNQLKELSPLNLPTDHPRPSIQTYKGAHHNFVLPGHFQGLLSRLEDEGCTPFMVFLCVFQILLARYTGQCDISVGSPIANRNQVELESLIGFFVNILVLRTDMSGDPSFQELLKRTRDTCIEAYAHSDLPFEKLVAEMHPDRDLSHQPLFQVSFALHNMPKEELAVSDLAVDVIDIDAEIVRYDLELHMWKSSDRYGCQVIYNTDLFDESTIVRMGEHFENLLESVDQDLSACLSSLQLLSDTEQHQLLVDWNETEVDIPDYPCLHQLFENSAVQNPDAVAVATGEEHVTYAELNNRSDALALYLQDRGVGPEICVGVCAEQSIEMIIGMLGILKAGGVYVPMDPQYPTHRLRVMIDELDVSILLIQKKLKADLADLGTRLICLDDDDFSCIDNGALENKTGPDNLAYVIYTSGSTGRPKGVMITHRGVCNLYEAQRQLFELDATCRVAQFASLSFDASIWEIIMALCSGACLCLPTAEQPIVGQALSDYLSENAITHATLPPSVLKTVSDGNLSSLGLLIVAGEACSAELVQKWAIDRVMVNAYGPTETTVCATAGSVKPDGSVPSMGRPIANMQTYILDESLRPVPIGAVGELYVGGTGISRGYNRRPDLTAERFVPDFLGDAPGTRLYRTGDLCKYLSDGRIGFLGRIDHQVKLRGYRIEPGEIENVLSKHDAVHESVVVSADIIGEERLFAYIVPDRQVLEKPSLHTGQVEQWKDIFDTNYQETTEDIDPNQNFLGWNSSYTGDPIPIEEMQAWLDDTVTGILSLEPGHVLEIGCGTGLLLSRIVPSCSSYLGTDFSHEVLSQVQSSLLKGQQSQVRLLQRSAHNFDGIDANSVDTVILNSVVQYFPSISYLMDVLDGALKALKAKGRIFIGDIRSLPLLEAFHVSTALHKASDSLSVRDLSKQVRQGIRQDEELVIDPAFFLALPQHFPKIKHVEIFPKKCDAQNELTKFRYQVVLHVSEDDVPKMDIPWIDWDKQDLDKHKLNALLEEEGRKVLGIRSIRNSHVASEVLAADLMFNGMADRSVSDLRMALSNTEMHGISLNEVCEVGESKGYQVNVSWSLVKGEFDVVFLAKSAITGAKPDFFNKKMEEKSWRDYANDPLQEKLSDFLVPELREFLLRRIPDYMVPSSFMLLDKIPLNTNGKIDRSNLPLPDGFRGYGVGDYIAPKTESEQKMAHIWSELLGVERVGVQDNFFELGGHSLLATQLMSRVRDNFQTDIPLSAFFERPTIDMMVGLIDQSEGQDLATEIAALSRDKYRVSMSDVNL